MPKAEPNIDLSTWNPAACRDGHTRTGIVATQDPDEPYDDTEPYAAMSVCHRTACQEIAMRKIAGQVNRRAYYFDDAERRAKKAEAAAT